jgi:hypothetical protein
VTKRRAELGFDLDELSSEMSGRKAQKPATQKTGRPRILDGGTVPLSVRITDEQRKWLVREAAKKTLETGQRQDVSQLVRELIDQARGQG